MRITKEKIVLVRVLSFSNVDMWRDQIGGLEERGALILVQMSGVWHVCRLVSRE